MDDLKDQIYWTVIYKVLFGGILLLLASWCYVIFGGSPPDVNPLHPEFSSMLRGSTDLNASIRYVGGFLGFCVFSIIILCLMVGARKKDAALRRKIYRVLLPVGISYVLIFFLLLRSYWQYVGVSEPSYFLGFPAPTAWMLYGIYFFPFIFTALYVLNFKSWVLSEEELVRFHKLVEEKSAEIKQNGRTT